MATLLQKVLRETQQIQRTKLPKGKKKKDSHAKAILTLQQFVSSVYRIQTSGFVPLPPPNIVKYWDIPFHWKAIVL